MKTSRNKGIYIVISGPAGSGKGTVVKLLREMITDIGFSVSATTRAARPGEVDGVHYHYITKEEFEKKLKNDEVLEHTQYCGNYYGTLKSEAERVIGEGKDLILEIEVDGAGQVKRACPDAVCVMLLPPDAQTLEARLRGRGTETDDVIRRRLARAREELECLPYYDYVVVNGEGEAQACAKKLYSIIEAEHARVGRMKEFTDSFFGEDK